MQKVIIHSPFIELAQLLKYAGLVETGGQAKIAVTSGLVRVNGEPATQRGRKIRHGDRVIFEGREIEIASEPETAV